MNLLFMNTLERKGEDERVLTAQVCIGEAKGVWSAIWSGTAEDGHVAQETWYEGQHWEELLNAFRARLSDKLKAGYVPLVSTSTWEEGVRGLGEKGRRNAILQCYAESHADADALALLRKWRRDTAAKLAKAPYLLATNRMLDMLAAYLPQTPEELKQIPGFGDGKAAQFGEGIFECTKQVERMSSFPLDWVYREVKEEALQRWLIEREERRTRLERERSGKKRQLLEAIWQGAALDQIAADLPLTRREAVLMAEELDAEGYDVTPLVEGELEKVGGDEKEKALQQFAEQGDRYLKPVFERVYPADVRKAIDADRTYQWLRLLRLQYRKSMRDLPQQPGDHAGAAFEDAHPQAG